MSIIRRINTHGDARISIQEFAHFLGESEFDFAPPINTVNKPKQSYQVFSMPHRAKQFETPSKLSSNIVKNLD